MSKALPPTVLRKMAVADLTPADYNPRAISQPALDGLTRSIEHFGVVQPIVWNVNSNRVVSGHQRLKALERLGIEETDVLVVDLDEQDEKALNILQNSGAISGFFTDDLAPLLAEIKEHFPAEFYEELRFDEIRIGDPLAVPEFGTGYAGNGDPDAVPETPADPTTKPGDLWILGKHRLLCGDATKREDVQTLLDGKRPPLMVTDPPYGVAVGSATAKASRLRISGDLTQAAIPISLAVAMEHLDANARIYIFGGSSNLAMYCGLFDLYLRQQPRVIIWVKESFVLRHVGYHSQYELIYHGWNGKGGGPEYWSGDRTQADVWRIDRTSDGLHPTQKPVELCEIPIKNHSREGEIVYDPFLGSGSTLIAAEHLSRRCFALEVDPGWCDVARDRWEAITGEKAVLAP